MPQRSERVAKLLLGDTSGRATLLAVLVTLVATYVFLTLLTVQKASANLGNISATKSCLATGCHNSPSASGKGYIGVAVNGVAQTLNASHTTPAVNVTPGSSFQIDWIYANMQGGSAGTYSDDNPLIAVPGTAAGANLWTIAPGTADNPGTITLYDNTATPATMTYAWDSTHWNAADTVTSTAAAAKGGASNIAGWNTTMADTTFGTTGPNAINMTGYTINYPTSGGGTYVWGSTNNLATDDQTTNDWDGAKGRMGVDAKITIPAGTATGSYNIFVYGIGHDGNSSGSKSNIKATIPVNVIPVVSSTSPNSITQGSAQMTLTINGSGFTSTGLSVASNDANITLGTATYVSANQVTVPITVTSSATIGSKNLTVTCSGVTSAAYSGFSVTSSLTATTTTVSSPAAITYGQDTGFTATVSPAAATGTVQFKVDGSNVGSPVTLSGGSASIAGISGLTAGSHTVTALYSGDATYAESTSAGTTQTVNQLVVTLTGLRTYDATTSASYSILSVSNKLGTDTVTVASGSATLASANVGTQAINSVGTLTLGGASAGNYTVTGATGSVTISKANSSVTTWPTASSITYGQSLASSALTGGSATPAGAFAFTTPTTAPSAGTTSQDVTFTPTDSANYNTAAGSVSVTVNKASQSITFPAPTISKIYGAADFSAIATTTSLLAVTYQSDNTAVATIDPVNGLVHIVSAGSATITANLAGDSNYEPASVQTALTVDKAILTVSANDASRVYGAPNPTFTPKYSGFVYGETAAVLSGAPDLTTSATSGSLAGSYPIDAALGTLAAANYSFSFGSGTLAIDIASQSITFNPLTNKTYGAAAFDLAATGGASGNPVSYDSSDLTVATVSGSTVTIVGAGTTTITAMQSGTTGAYASATAQQSLTIDKATLSVSAQNTSRAYGTANPTFTPTYSGFVYSDTAAVLTGAPDLTTAATIASPVGSYAIVADTGTLTAANYSFTFSPGTLAIDQATQNIVFAALPGKTYGDTTFDLSATGGDSGNPVTFSSSNLAVATISGSTVTIVGAGSADITASQTGNSNYAAASALQTLSVAKAALTVTALPATRVYGAANPALLPDFSGFVNSDTAAVLQGSPDLSTTADASSPVASYGISVAAGNLFSNNYSFSFVNGSLSVTKAPLTVTADNATRAYGAADPAFTASYSGFVNGESVAVISGQPTFSTTATVSSPAGTYPITPAVGTLAAANYSFVMQPGTLTVTPVAANATLSVTITGAGGGSVNSSPTAIACTSGSSTDCSKTFATGTPVTLTATPDWKSIFTGWGLPCSGTGSCLITLDGDAGVSATFAINGQATVLGHTITEYGSLQDAYNAANNGKIVAAHVYTFIENLSLDRAIAVTLDMGKGDMYLSTVGYSTLQGSLTIGQGTATINNLIIK